MAKYPDVHVRLSGEDGNIFFIMGRISAALRRAGVDDAEVGQFLNEVRNTGSYDEALRVCMAWVACS